MTLRCAGQTVDDVVVWLGRIVKFLPELIGLWQAAKDPNPQAHLNASLALVRKMKDAQAAEEMGP
jgi:hypothetical protein